MTETREMAGEAAAWWRDLQDTRSDGSPNPRADRRARAVLRRTTPLEALEEESVFVLHRRLWPGTAELRQRQIELTLRVALVLAHARSDDEIRVNGRRRSFARTIGRPSFDSPEGAALSPLRFRRLLAAREPDEIVREFRRAVDIAGGAVNVSDLAAVLLGWERDEVRTRFAFDYFSAGQAGVDTPAAEPA